MMTQSRQFIDHLAAGDSSAAKETIENALSTRAFEALDAHKKQLASSIFGGKPEEETNATEVEVQETE
jgi:hypothetical protein